MSRRLLVDCPLPSVLVRPKTESAVDRPVRVGKGREEASSLCIVETLSSYLFTRLTSIGCLSGLCFILWGHLIGSASLVRFRMALQAKVSSPGGGASAYAFQ